MSYWVNTVSNDHVQQGIAGGFTQANHGSPRNLKRLRRGDWLVFYSPKTAFKQGKPLQQFTAIGQIIDDVVYQVEMRPDFHPFRRAMAFYPSRPSAIRPLIPALDFLPDKQRWGLPFRRGMFQIGRDNFLLIAHQMDVDGSLMQRLQVANSQSGCEKSSSE